MDLSQAERIISGKRLLIADDEKDVLDTLVVLLQVCKIDAVSSFEEARTLLETNSYDLAILDIMGVDGYGLLDIAVKKKTFTYAHSTCAFEREPYALGEKRGFVFCAQG
jgi:PleD family two-component response regulator